MKPVFPPHAFQTHESPTLLGSLYSHLHPFPPQCSQRLHSSHLPPKPCLVHFSNLSTEPCSPLLPSLYQPVPSTPTSSLPNGALIHASLSSSSLSAALHSERRVLAANPDIFIRGCFFTFFLVCILKDREEFQAALLPSPCSCNVRSPLFWIGPIAWPLHQDVAVIPVQGVGGSMLRERG